MGVLERAKAHLVGPAGEEKSRFAVCVVPEIEPLLRLALAMTRQRADAEDLVQETLMRAYRSMDRFDGEHPRAWLYTIMRRIRVDAYRHKRAVVVADIDAPEFTASANASVDSAEEEVLGETFDEVVQAAYDGLSLVDQEVLRMVDIGGLSYAEGASALGISVEAMTSRLHRARAHLRNRLDETGLAPKPRFLWEQGSYRKGGRNDFPTPN